jgi:hypothetical protein
MAMTFDNGALRTTILTLTKFGHSEQKAARAAAAEAGKELKRRIKANISLTDHTLEDLADMDHPYARRHGSIGVHRSGASSLTHPEFRVHSQSGSLVNALKGSPGFGASYKVEIDSGIAPHAPFVIVGTRVMLGRDVLWSTAESQETQRAMMKRIVRKLGKIMRTGAALRFQPGKAPRGSGGVG